MITPCRENDLLDEREVMVKKFLDLNLNESLEVVEGFLKEKNIDVAVPGAYNLVMSITEAVAKARTRAIEYLTK